MIEAVGFVVLAIVVISVVQSMTRSRSAGDGRSARTRSVGTPGTASSVACVEIPEDPDDGLTLVEELHRGARRFREAVEFKVAHCGWFSDFEREIRRKQKVAVAQVAHDRRMADPGFAAAYEHVRKSMDGSDAMPASRTQPLSGSASGPVLLRLLANAKPPQVDPTWTEEEVSIFETRRAEHDEFVARIREELRRDPDVHQAFLEQWPPVGRGVLARTLFAR